MALPSIHTANLAVKSLYNLFSTYKTAQMNRQNVVKMNEVYNAVVRTLKPVVSLTVTDTTDANLTAFISAAGQLGIAVGGSAANAQIAPVGTVFKVLGTGDTTDNALEAAKLAGLGWNIAKTYTDLTDATLTAFLAITGAIPAILGRVMLPGERFKLGGAGDTTDNALEGVKGSAVAAKDVFEVNAAGTGVTYVGSGAAVASGDVFIVTSASAVTYLGTATELDLTAYEATDFVSIGA